MNLFDILWPDIIAFAIASALLNGAISGRFYSSGRGGGKKIFATVDSVWWRLLSFALSLAISAGIVIDLRRKFH